MATYAECLVALPSFRNELLRDTSLSAGGPALPFTFSPHGAFSAFARPLTNVHATGVGIRQRQGKYVRGEHVIKVFVFDKVQGEVPGVPPSYDQGRIPVDIEQLPVQVIRPSSSAVANNPSASETQPVAAAVNAEAGTVLEAPQQLPPQCENIRPIVAGISISPLDANFAGTLGCFLLRQNIATQEVFVLSNNHVLADVGRLPAGTKVCQPGPEVPPFHTDAATAFATLHSAIPIEFPNTSTEPVFNRFDAAIANVTNGDIIQRAQMFGMVQAGQPNPNNLPVYDPSRVVSPEPDMRVMKIGRTTGFTRGLITATNVQGVQVNYGTNQFPVIAVFRGVTTIIGDDNKPFSLPGDSGSVILEEATGHPVGLLFAGDGVKTMACDLGALCQQLGAWPI
jgi:hypothetical protein